MKKEWAKNSIIAFLGLSNVLTFACLVSTRAEGAKAPKAAAAPPQGPPAAKSAVGAMVKGARAHSDNELQVCYESFLVRKNEVQEGVVEAHWLLDKRGKVSSLEIIRNDLKDQIFTDCVLDRLKKRTFPPPALARPTLVAHKFKFHRRTPGSLTFKMANESQD